ncbi:MAG TPA: FecR family protein [Cyclobacteriaceae bacterium]
MTKDEFQKLLQRYRAGNCSEDEIVKINHWYDRISDDHLELNEWEKADVKGRIRSHLDDTLGADHKKPQIKQPVFVTLKIAASFLVLVLVGYSIFNRNSKDSNVEVPGPLSSIEQIEHKNVTQGIVKVQLPDSSMVELQPGAEVSYVKSWGSKKREVHLTGEAFFEVVKDASRPFYVYGGSVVTKVLGTSFTVKAAKDAESIEVEVRTGKVSVYEGANQNNTAPNNEVTGVILTPNERVEYFVDDKHWVTSLVEQPKRLSETTKVSEFMFSDTPMSEVVKNIEKSYSIDIIIENEASYSCTFTGDVSQMELYDMLEVICKSTGVDFEVKGTKILITGNGCQ